MEHRVTHYCSAQWQMLLQHKAAHVVQLSALNRPAPSKARKHMPGWCKRSPQTSCPFIQGPHRQADAVAQTHSSTCTATCRQCRTIQQSPGSGWP